MTSFKSNRLQVYSTDEEKQLLIDSTDSTQVKISATHGTIAYQPGTKLKVYGNDNSKYIDDVYSYLKSLSDSITQNSTEDLAAALSDQVARDSIVSAQAQIDTAQSAAITSVTETANTINANLTSLVADEATVRDACDNEIIVSINSLTSVVTQNNTTLTSNLATEVTDRQSAVSQAVSDFEAADTVLTASVSSLDTNLTSVIDQLEVDLSNAIANNKTNLESEVSRATTAESNNAAAIATEKSRAEGAEQSVQSNVNAESSARAAGDSNLQLQITNEAITRGAQTGTNSTAIANEVVRATIAEALLEASVNQEVSDRSSAVSNLTSVVTNNKSVYDAYVLFNNNVIAVMDASFSEDLSAEQSRAEAAEVVLTNNLAAEVTDRTSGDTGLQGQVDTLNTALTLLTNRFDTLVSELGN